MKAWKVRCWKFSQKKSSLSPLMYLSFHYTRLFSSQNSLNREKKLSYLIHYSLHFSFYKNFLFYSLQFFIFFISLHKKLASRHVVLILFNVLKYIFCYACVGLFIIFMLVQTSMLRRVKEKKWKSLPINPRKWFYFFFHYLQSKRNIFFI